MRIVAVPSQIEAGDSDELPVYKREKFSVRKPLGSKKPDTYRQVVVARKAPDVAKLRDVDYTGPAGPK